MDSIQIQLLTQSWIDGLPDDGKDFCSHGKVLLKVNDFVLCDENSGNWTVASSALRLMKSAIYEYNSKIEFEIIPCCGYLRAFPSCPNYITWDTEIKDDMIIVSNIQISRNEKNGLRLINDSFTSDYKQYIKQVMSFADKVKEFYSLSILREFYDEFDEKEYDLFWKEFNEYYQILSERT